MKEKLFLTNWGEAYYDENGDIIFTGKGIGWVFKGRMERIDEEKS